MSEKEEKDCNGVEAELFALIKDGKTNWIPLERSRTLGLIN